MSQEPVWWCSREGNRWGPFSETDFKAMAASGQLQPSDLVWKEGFTDWVAAESVPDLIRSSQTAMPPPLPSNASHPSSGNARSPSPPAAQGQSFLQNIMGLFEQKKPSDSKLSADIRDNYVQKLAEKGALGTFVAAFGITLLVAYGLRDIISIYNWVLLLVSGAITAIWFALRCKHFSSYTDEMLQVAYQELVAQNRTNQVIKTVIIAAIAIIGVYVLTNDKARIMVEKTISRANCEILSKKGQQEALASGYRIYVHGSIKNNGKIGNIFVTARLFSSEGEQEKGQKISLLPGMTENVSYTFTELSRNATDIRYTLECAPQRTTN